MSLVPPPHSLLVWWFFTMHALPEASPRSRKSYPTKSHTFLGFFFCFLLFGFFSYYSYLQVYLHHVVRRMDGWMTSPNAGTVPIQLLFLPSLPCLPYPERASSPSWEVS